MRKIKNGIAVCAAMFIVSCSVMIPAMAHPGRTDGQGGHTNKSTGEYHYHHGYPEHQHPNGVCPYNFYDKNEGTTGGSSNKTEKQQSATVYEKPVEQKPVVIETKQEEQDPDIVDRILSSNAIYVLPVTAVVLALILKKK